MIFRVQFTACFYSFNEGCSCLIVNMKITDGDKNLNLVDAPVSGGVQRASLGTLTV
jgi:hypothetical protein